MSTSQLAGQCVLVTGGGSGIGAGVAQYLVKHGAKVVICGRRKGKLEAVVDDLGELCVGVQADVCVAQDRERVLAAALKHGGKLDGLVNNAGNMYRGALEDLSEDKLLEVFHGNVIAGMMLSGLCAPHLAGTAGAIIFLGSVHTRRAFPGVSPYAATKGAIEALTKSLAAELGERGVRVNCVAPGAVYSEINQRAGLLDDKQALDRLNGMASLHALGRIGTVEEVAQAVGYFLSAPWTTGATLEVDGGLALGLTRDNV